MGQSDRYIVDYDLPRDSRRKRFYRAIQKYLRENMLEDTGWSTQSVVVTKSANFAWEVYYQARKVGGISHIYLGRLLDTEGKGEVSE
ncbi:hypothetical protein ES705_31588 [subsurface metagenome]